jgi:hypothetical protein
MLALVKCTAMLGQPNCFGPYISPLPALHDAAFALCISINCVSIYCHCVHAATTVCVSTLLPLCACHCVHVANHVSARLSSAAGYQVSCAV